MVSDLLSSLRRGGLQHLEEVLVLKHPEKDKFRFVVKMKEVPSQTAGSALKKYARTYAKESGWALTIKITKDCLILEPNSIGAKSQSEKT